MNHRQSIDGQEALSSKEVRCRVFPPKSTILEISCFCSRKHRVALHQPCRSFFPSLLLLFFGFFVCSSLEDLATCSWTNLFKAMRRACGAFNSFCFSSSLAALLIGRYPADQQHDIKCRHVPGRRWLSSYCLSSSCEVRWSVQIPWVV